MKEIGIYIHIPFCKSKCYYCDFTSFPCKNNLIEQYIKALLDEISIFKDSFKDNLLKTIYIGGGTPSYIDSKFIKEILNAIQFENQTVEEITIEINPGTITKNKLLDYLEAGVNRLSVGLQSTNDMLLKSIGRIHTYKEFEDTFKLAREVGFKNINVDVMFGLPNQTLEDIKDTIEKVLKLNPEHISTYSLILEEGTKLYNEQDNLKLPNEVEERRMYHYIIDTLKEEGYIQYEISNFAKKNYESKHNVSCWKQFQYKGFGLAAHSYIDNVRYSNICNINEYIKNIANKEFEKNIIIHERQTLEDKLKEKIMLGLRMIEGISIEKINKEFDINILEKFKEELKYLKENGLIEINERIKLSDKGLDYANLVWEKFV